VCLEPAVPRTSLHLCTFVLPSTTRRVLTRASSVPVACPVHECTQRPVPACPRGELRTCSCSRLAPACCAATLRLEHAPSMQRLLCLPHEFLPAYLESGALFAIALAPHRSAISTRITLNFFFDPSLFPLTTQRHSPTITNTTSFKQFFATFQEQHASSHIISPPPANNFPLSSCHSPTSVSGWPSHSLV
jgi:hypothetical protein